MFHIEELERIIEALKAEANKSSNERDGFEHAARMVNAAKIQLERIIFRQSI